MPTDEQHTVTCRACGKTFKIRGFTPEELAKPRVLEVCQELSKHLQKKHREIFEEAVDMGKRLYGLTVYTSYYHEDSVLIAGLNAERSAFHEATEGGIPVASPLVRY